MSYNPHNWFWIVGGDAAQAWSSAMGAYVADYPGDQVTRIANEVELYDVLAKAGLAAKAPGHTFSVSEVRDALLAIDSATVGDAADAAALSAAAATMGLVLPPFV